MRSLRPFIRREAVLSSRIEGTQATLGELLAAEAGAAVERSPDDLREVGNYVAALEYGVKRLKSFPLSLRLVRELHEKLMKDVRGDRAAPGEFRRSQNWIGTPGCALSDASYVPPHPDALMDCLGSWEKFLHEKTLPPLVQAALAHYQFEAIHPFLDGNGRLGRPSKAAGMLVDLLAANPFITINMAAKDLKIAFTTAQRGIERLQRLGIVSQSGKAKRDRVFCAEAILSILEEPARIVPASR